jgi:hypothetical protein
MVKTKSKTKSRGTGTTKLSKSDWRTELYSKNSSYKSKWRIRKEKRALNNYNYKNNVNTPSTNMMHNNNIDPTRNDSQKYFSKELVESETLDSKNRQLTIQHRQECSEEWVKYSNVIHNERQTFREFLEKN